MADPKVDKGSFFNGQIRVDSNREKYLRESTLWARFIVLPKRGLRQNLLESMAWVCFSGLFYLALEAVRFYLEPGVILAIMLLTYGFLGIVFLAAIDKTSDMWYVSYRIALMALGVLYVRH